MNSIDKDMKSMDDYYSCPKYPGKSCFILHHFEHFDCYNPTKCKRAIKASLERREHQPDEDEDEDYDWSGIEQDTSESDEPIAFADWTPC